MDLKPKVYPVDRLLVVYNVVMLAVWASGPEGWIWRTPIMVAHAVAAGLPWLLERAGRPSRPGRLLRQVYPAIWIPAFWTEVDLVRRHVRSGAHDALILRIEEALFGVHPHAVWMPRMHDLWFSELLHFSYFAYYGVLVAPVIWLVLRGRQDETMEALFRMIATFGTCFVLYSVFPVDGPQHTGPMFDGPNGDGLFARLVVAVAGGNGESLGAAFPSSHVAGAVTMAWIARLHLPRWAYRLAAVEAAGVVLATFYIQRHYALDSAAGLILAVVIQGMIVPAVLARTTRRADRPRVVRPLRTLPVRAGPGSAR